MKSFPTLFALLLVAILVLDSVPPVTSERLTEFKLDERPEGITSGPGSTLYVSQILSGKVLAIDADTGTTTTVVDEQDGRRQAWGLWYHEGHIFVGGGGPPFGGGDPKIYVYNVETGESVVECSPLRTNETGNGIFINDVTVFKGVAYVTDSFSNTLMALSVADAFAGNCTVWELFLPDQFIPSSSEDWGANGIVAYEFDNGVSGLLVAHETLGAVWSVQNYEKDGPPPSYQPIIYDDGSPGSESAPGADGLLIVEDKLYVTQNSQNQIGVYNLTAQDDGALMGAKVGILTASDFDTPATSAAYDGYIYSTNSRFFSLDEISDEADDNVIGVKNVFCCGNNGTADESSDPTAAPTPGGESDILMTFNAEYSFSQSQTPRSCLSSTTLPMKEEPAVRAPSGLHTMEPLWRHGWKLSLRAWVFSPLYSLSFAYGVQL